MIMLRSVTEILDKIKLIFYSPKHYLNHYFDELRILVNIETELFLQKQSSHKTEQAIKALTSQERMLNELDSFEEFCQASLTRDKLDEEWTKRVKQEIENVESKLMGAGLEIETELLFELRGLTRSILSDLQTHLFRGKSVHFIQKDKLVEILTDYNFNMDSRLKTFAELQIVGILIIIEDSFIDKSYLELNQ